MKTKSDEKSEKKREIVETDSNTFKLLKGWIREDIRYISSPPPEGVSHEEVKEIN